MWKFGSVVKIVTRCALHENMAALEAFSEMCSCLHGTVQGLLRSNLPIFGPQLKILHIYWIKQRNCIGQCLDKRCGSWQWTCMAGDSIQTQSALRSLEVCFLWGSFSQDPSSGKKADRHLKSICPRNQTAGFTTCFVLGFVFLLFKKSTLLAL